MSISDAWQSVVVDAERFISSDDPTFARLERFENFILDVLDGQLRLTDNAITSAEKMARSNRTASITLHEVSKVLSMGARVSETADVVGLATTRMEEYRQMAERFMAIESAAAHQPRPVAAKDETWIAKTTTVRIGESLQYKRIKITGVQPAAGGLPARYRFTVLNPGDKMQTGSSCSEESLLGHYVREQQPSLPGTDDRVISVDTSDGSRSLTLPAPASPISVTTGPAGEMIIGLPVNPAEGTAVIIDGATRTATVSYPKPASDAAVGLP